MAKHIVKCAVCKKEFNLNEIQGVKYNGRRYAHKDCFPDGKLVPMEPSKKREPATSNSELKELKDYINEVYGDKANWSIINKQIKRYTKENQFSLTGILKTLKYIYEIKKLDTDKSNGGIGLVEYLYQESYNYYLNMFLTQQTTVASEVNKTTKEIIINPSISKGLRKKFFNIEDYVDEE